VRYCDGWLPFDGLGGKLDQFTAELHQQAEAAGRDPASISISVFCFERPDEAKSEHYRTLGAERVVLVAPRQTDSAMGYLDALAPLIEKFSD